jgi:hypothetical protein
VALPAVHVRRSVLCLVVIVVMHWLGITEGSCVVVLYWLRITHEGGHVHPC